MIKRKWNVVLWTVQVILALLFVLSGVSKFVMPVEEMTKDVALPVWFLRFIGVAEIIGAIGLILPWALKIRQGLTPLAACALILILIGAVVVSLMTPNPGTAILPLVTGVLTGFVAYGRSGRAEKFMEVRA